jgi:hypothetical protein
MREVSVRASSARTKFRPGDLAPITGTYRVTHGVPHRDRHQVVIIRGEHLPTCRTCQLNVSFEIVRPVSHVTHDWDFAGPHNLAVKPQLQSDQNFRMYQRAHIQLPIKLRLSGSSTSGLTHGMSIDLGAGGLGVVIRTPVSPLLKTEAVTIILERAPDWLSLQARLRYQSGLRYGFEFLNLTPTQQQAIRRMIARRNPRAGAQTG